MFLPLGVYARNQGMNGNYTQAYRNRSVNMICEKGEAILTQADNLVWSQHENTNVYTAQRTAITNVIDISDVKNGNIIFLDKVTTLNECVENENTYYYDNTNIYVHMKYNQVPSFNKLICPLTISNTVFMARALTENAKFYFENITTIGGDYGNVFMQSDSTHIGTFIAKNCKFLGANYNSDHEYDNFSIQGGNAILQNCMASYGKKDGFNYHAQSGIIPQAVEINCKGSYNGYNAPSSIANSCNGSTIHDGGKIIRFNCVYNNNYGPNVADVSNNSLSLNYNVSSFDSLASENRADFLTGQGTSKMYLYNCYSKNSNTNTNLLAQSNSTIYYSNSEFDTSSGNVIEI